MHTFDSQLGTLYIVATPIGNLEDITLRAIRILKEVDLIACEDTRVTGVLLKHYEIKTPMVSYFQHSKLSKIEYLIAQLRVGKNIALVTDAGTPGISDPGQVLIQRIREFSISNFQFSIKSQTSKFQGDTPSSMQMGEEPALSVSRMGWGEGIKIIPVPGPSALTAAASVSGMIEKELYFAGFLPKKKGRQTQLKLLKLLNCPIVIYESALRLERTLNDIRQYLGEDAEVFIAREITKMFEEYWGGAIDEVLAGLSKHKMKGELVLIIKSANSKAKREQEEE